MSHKQQMLKRLTNEEYLVKAPHFDILTHNVDDIWPLHSHEFYELELVLSGEGVHSMNGIESKLSKGDMYLLTPADFHEVQPWNQNGLELINIKYSEGVVSEELHLFLFTSGKTMMAHLEGKSYDRMYTELFRLMEEHNNPMPGSDIIIRGGLERILIDLFRNSTEQHNSMDFKESNDIIKTIIFINHHFRESITLKQIAYKVHLSANYFSECFHQATGKSFREYLLYLRLSHAKALLSISSVSVTEVCFTSGFNSIPYFNRAFKKMFGQSPNTYRKNIADKK